MTDYDLTVATIAMIYPTNEVRDFTPDSREGRTYHSNRQEDQDNWSSPLESV